MFKKPLKFKPETEALIQRVLPNRTEFDDPDFDYVAYINEKYSSDSDLPKLKSDSQILEHDVKNLNNKITELIANQIYSLNDINAKFTQSKDTASILYEKITELRGQADQSELLVHKLCEEIKRFDTAKVHLKTGVDTLEKLEVFVTELQLLETHYANKDFINCGSVIKKLNPLSEYFKNYMHINMIKHLLNKYNNIKSGLGEFILDEFKIFDLLNKELVTDDDRDIVIGKSKTLSSLSIILSLLPETFKTKLIKDFCRGQFVQYSETFNPIHNTDHSDLKNVDRRFHLFRQVISKYDQFFKEIFPPSYSMKALICISFLDITKGHFQYILQNKNVHIDILINTIKKVLIFENQARVFFGARTSSIDVDDLEEVEIKHDLPNIKGYLSSMFDPYLTDYVDRKNIQLCDIIKQNTVYKDVVESDRILVFASFNEVMKSIKEIITECTIISNGECLFKIYEGIINNLKLYGRMLQDKIPKATKNNFFNIDIVNLVDSDDYINNCIILNTAEAVIKIAPSIETRIRDKILNDYKENVNLTDAISDDFGLISSTVNNLLVHALIAECEKPLKSFLSTNFNTQFKILNEGPYVKHFTQIFTSYVPVVRSNLDKDSFNNFCNRFVKIFGDHLPQCILKIKEVHPTAFDQLRCDIEALKQLFLDLPKLSLGDDSDFTISSIYIRSVKKSFNKPEFYIKIASCNKEHVPQMFVELLPDGKGEELNILLRMKGIPLKERQELLKSVNLTVDEDNGLLSKMFNW